MEKAHPRLFLDQEGLDAMRMRALQGDTEFEEAWARLQSIADRALEQPLPAPYQGDNARQYYLKGQAAGAMARDLALAYHISGKQDYANRAVAILDAWASATPLPGTSLSEKIHYPNLGMMVARGSLPFIWTYDLLYTNASMTHAKREQVQRWFRALVKVIKEGSRRWEENDYFNKQFYQNHLVADALGLLAIAYATGDQELAQYALDSDKNPRDYRELLTGVILMPGDEPYYREPGDFTVRPGEIMDRYRHFALGGHYGDYVTKANRALQYSHLSLRQLSLMAEITRTNGLDLYGYTAPGGENLETSWTFLAEYYQPGFVIPKGDFYEGESARIGKGGDPTTFFEFAYACYPENLKLQKLIANLDRGKQPRTECIGWPVLTHGRTLPTDEQR